MPIDKKFFRNWALFVLGALLVAVYSWGLNKPTMPYFDEVHYVGFVRGLLDQHRFIETANVHPPLWHLLMAFTVLILGDVAVAWRLVSLIAGILLFIPLYLVAKRITQSRSVAFLSVFLLAFDCLSLTQARAAMMNPLMMLFILWGIHFFFEAWPPKAKMRREPFFYCGLFMGLALATKLVTLSVYLFLFPLLAVEWFKRKQERGRILKDTGIFLLLVPAFLFVASYLFVPFLKGRTWSDIWGIWRFHMDYNLTMNQTHSYSSRWWSWPLMLRPIWFYFTAQRWGMPDGMMSGIIGIGNPAVFWMIPVAVINLIVMSIFRKSRTAAIVLLGFLTQWLAFAPMKRLQFFHYFYSVMPFVVMALGLLLKELWAQKGVWRVMVVFYLILVAGMFVFWYPLLANIPISNAYYDQHIWFRSWI